MITYEQLHDLEKNLLKRAYDIYLLDPERYGKLTHFDLVAFGVYVKLEYNTPLHKAYNHLFDEGLLFHFPVNLEMRYGLSPDGIQLMNAANL